MIREVSIDGIFFAAIVQQIAITVAICYALVTLLHRFDGYRFIWHPALFNTALFVIILGIVALVTLQV